MQKQYDNTNTGMTYQNDNKKSDKHPDMKGSINIEGKEYWLAGWHKETRRGPIVSWKASPKEEGYRKKEPTQVGVVIDNDLNDDLPF